VPAYQIIFSCLSHTRKRGGRSALRAVGASALGALALSGCGSGAEGPTPADVLHVKERDFKVSATPPVLRSREVTLEIRNSGPDVHELIVVRKTDRKLPLRRDGLTVNEEALEPVTAGALEPVQPGAYALRVHLRPGRYVLFCNMAGHYSAGMYRELVVQ
jgi:uncharacterized cupredoxin-like copper-binding protein